MAAGSRSSERLGVQNQPRQFPARAERRGLGDRWLLATAQGQKGATGLAAEGAGWKQGREETRPEAQEGNRPREGTATPPGNSGPWADGTEDMVSGAEDAGETEASPRPVGTMYHPPAPTAPEVISRDTHTQLIYWSLHSKMLPITC